MNPTKQEAQLRALNGALDRLAFYVADNATRTSDVRQIRMLLAALNPTIAPGGDGMSAWIGKLGALVSAAKYRDLSAKDHAEAIDKAHSELFDTLRSLPAAANAVDDAMVEQLRADATTLANHWDEQLAGEIDDPDALVERLYALWAALAPAAQQDGHMELAVAIAASKTADPPAAAHGYNCGVNDAIVGECSCSLKTK